MLTRASGTAAVELALRGLKIGAGDEVLLSAYDFKGNFQNILTVGAMPVLVDISPLPQIGAVLVLTWIGVLIARRYVATSPRSAALVAFPLGAHPFFLENLSYKFDALSMSLAILLAVLPIVALDAGRRGWWLGVLAIFASLNFYQPAINVFRKADSNTVYNAATVWDKTVMTERYILEDDGRVRLQYRPNNVSPHEQLVAETRRILRRLGFWVVVAHSHKEKNTTHQCGTLCFGTNPRESVLDPFCRTHDIDNLFVVDASFFPSSAAVTPGLTIAAQALRVADHIRDAHFK